MMSLWRAHIFCVARHPLVRYSTTMRILITTGIFEPESGGPATYAPEIAKRLVAAGHTVTVLTLSPTATDPEDSKYPFRLVRVKRMGPIINRINMFTAIRAEANACDIIYSLDYYAVGLPVAIAASLSKRDYVVRVGGDYLWESHFSKAGVTPTTLTEFYQKGMHTGFPSFFAYQLIRYVLGNAKHVIFNSDGQHDLYKTYYGLSDGRTSVIYNAKPEITFEQTNDAVAPAQEFVFWGRLIPLKNLDTLIKAFAMAAIPKEYRLTIIGEGPDRARLLHLITELQQTNRVTIFPGLSQKDIYIRVRNARGCILASWSDISPNQVCEALAIGVPGIVTEETFLPFRDQLPATVSPRLMNDIAKKIEAFVDPVQYEEFKRRWNAISFIQTWDMITKRHVDLFDSLKTL